jgi:molybdenum cofactor cytidylyltransferase
MKLEPVPIQHALNKILVHNVARADGRRAIRKGTCLTASHIATLQALGREMVYVAALEAGDVAENEAANRVAVATTGVGLRLTNGNTGRVNAVAEALGVLRVDGARVTALNGIAGVTLATLRAGCVVNAGKTVATTKIIPYAVPETSVAEAEAIAHTPLLWVDVLRETKVGVILSGNVATEVRVVGGFMPALSNRLTPLRATITHTAFVPLEDDKGERALAHKIAEFSNHVDLIILAGETAIMDRYDIAPRAVERAGGAITCFGAPVDPGNLLMIGYFSPNNLQSPISNPPIPILGAPGCVRSPKANIIDLVLPRLLVGDYLTQADIAQWGHGGLLEDVPERPLPRSRLT